MDPVGISVGISALLISTMQFALQLKTYLHDKMKRKRQEQEEEQHHPHHHHMYPHSSTPSDPIIYYICYNIYQAPYPYHNALPHLYYHHNHTYSPSILPSAEPSSSRCDASKPSYDWLGLLGGRMELLHHQQAPHNTHCVRETLGMRTGACAFNSRESSYHHWKSVQEESSQGYYLQKTIAVVDWSRGNIDMFMEIGGAYFRNYRISRCDVEMFAYLFKEREVFSGEIRDGKLERFNKEMKMVENVSGVRSTNSWMSLGIYDESEDMNVVLSEEGSFVQTVRGAVFGLVCCVYEAPSDLNVDMEAPHIYGQLDIVRVNTHQQPCHIQKRRSCLFSVFSFGDHGWAAQEILLG